MWILATPDPCFYRQGIQMSIIFLVVNMGYITTTNPRLMCTWTIIVVPAVVIWNAPEADTINPAARREITNNVGVANIGPVETMLNVKAAVTIP